MLQQSVVSRRQLLHARQDRAIVGHVPPGEVVFDRKRIEDVFDFDFVTDSGPGAAARDVCQAGDGAIAFEGAGIAGGDLFDLSGIDANATAGGNQAFVFGGAGIGRVSVVASGSASIRVGAGSAIPASLARPTKASPA